MRRTWRSDVAVAAKPVGTVGGVVSVGGSLVTTTATQLTRLYVLVEADSWLILTRRSVDGTFEGGVLRMGPPRTVFLLKEKQAAPGN